MTLVSFCVLHLSSINTLHDTLTISQRDLFNVRNAYRQRDSQTCHSQPAASGDSSNCSHDNAEENARSASMRALQSKQDTRPQFNEFAHWIVCACAWFSGAVITKYIITHAQRILINVIKPLCSQWMSTNWGCNSERGVSFRWPFYTLCQDTDI